ncbi:MAG: argE [Ilumatobacteraceae bacterium]|nr:argE [Ilumatobacteraceae bacterium]
MGTLAPMPTADARSIEPAGITRVRALLADLVAMPTESRSSNLALIDWAADHLHTFGAQVSIIAGQAGRANLLATVGPTGRGGILLSGHTDVVPAGDGWATPPYELTATSGSGAAGTGTGDVLRGRGTADMKGFIACVLATVEALDPATLTRPVHVALSYDEEIGCVGVRGLLHELGGGASRGDVRPDLVVIGEPTMMRPRHAHLGKVAFRIACTARAGHSSLSPFLPSAIGSAVHLITTLESVAEPHRSSATRDATGEASADVTVNVGTVHGGTALNVLAEQCEITFELRHTTAFDPDELLAPVWAAIDREREALEAVGGGIDVEEITRYPALLTDRADAMVRLVERVADRGPTVPLGFGTEGGLFAAAVDAPVVICGPGDIAVAHRPDEHVSIEQLEACLDFLAPLIAGVCT